MNHKILFASIITLLASQAANANTINFADRPAGPSVFASAGPAQTLIYHDGGVDITFAGGVILTNETNQSTNFNNVYATASFGDPSLSNPLTLTFSEQLKNFSVTISNAVAGDFLLADNAGHSSKFTLATMGSSAVTETFALTGNVVTITELTSTLPSTPWDFAIGQISFDCSANLAGCQAGPVPEPTSTVLLGLGLMGMLFSTRRKFN